MLGTSLLWRSTAAFTYLKVKFVKCLCLLPVVLVLFFGLVHGLLSSGLGLGLVTLVLVLRIWSSLHHWLKLYQEPLAPNVASDRVFSDAGLKMCNSPPPPSERRNTDSWVVQATDEKWLENRQKRGEGYENNDCEALKMTTTTKTQ